MKTCSRMVVFVGAVGLGEAQAHGLATGLQVSLAVGQLLLEQTQREVRLTLLVDEPGVLVLDLLDAGLDLDDALARALQVSGDLLELCHRLADGRLRVLLVLLQLGHELLGLVDGLRQRRLTLLGVGDLVLQAGSI